jgi:hypothetical protein
MLCHSVIFIAFSVFTAAIDIYMRLTPASFDRELPRYTCIRGI